MEKFCIITNSDKDTNYQTAEYIKSYLNSIKKTCIIIRDTYGNSQCDNSYMEIKEIPNDIQCAIVLGGDGTMIEASNKLIGKELPILGVNLGTLGFLTEIEKDNIIPAIDQLVQDHYKIEKRMMLKGNICCKGEKIRSGYALNDFVVCKKGYCHVISVKVYVNGDLIDTYVGDGVIVSTSTGSTAYNLSAGGAILSPEIEAIIITPICPHSFNKRSLVVAATDRILLKVGRSKGEKNDEAVAVQDGNMVMEMQTGDGITIEKASMVTKFLKLKNTSFYERLRNKIGRG